MPHFEADAWLGIVAGGTLAFHAFLGFEDIVNVVEETRESEWGLLQAIIATLLINLVLYGFVVGLGSAKARPRWRFYIRRKQKLRVGLSPRLLSSPF
jgi:hypothetical protein